MKTPQQAYEDAKSGINVQENEHIILNSGDGYWIFRFARDIHNANISCLEDAMLNSGYILGFYFFAKEVDKSDKQKISDYVLNTFEHDLIKVYYEEINFDKSKYDSYFRNLIFI